MSRTITVLGPKGGQGATTVAAALAAFAARPITLAVPDVAAAATLLGLPRTGGWDPVQATPTMWLATEQVPGTDGTCDASRATSPRSTRPRWRQAGQRRLPSVVPPTSSPSVTPSGRRADGTGQGSRPVRSPCHDGDRRTGPGVSTIDFSGAKGGQGTTTVAAAAAVFATGHRTTTLVTEAVAETGDPARARPATGHRTDPRDADPLARRRGHRWQRGSQ